MSLNSFNTKDSITIDGKKYTYFNLKKLEAQGFAVSKLPYSHRVLLENLLRCEDGLSVSKKDIEALATIDVQNVGEKEINFTPARVILQDFTGVPAVVDLAAMRDAIKALGGNPETINPLKPVELVIDHSVQVDFSASVDAEKKNTDLEFVRNQERYEFLRWGQKAFKNFKVVPPGAGIVHQVNLEFLARVVMTEEKKGEHLILPDTVVGTDSHTTMINGLGVLGWGVGGIEAEAGMLGQPSTMLIPEVVGFKLEGKLQPGVTATDLVLTVTQMLRKKGVVGKFVEFYGEGAKSLTLSDRATIANMAPEYGATCGFFPVDEVTLCYLRLTGRTEKHIELIRSYLTAQGLFWENSADEPNYSSTLNLDLSIVEPSLAGPSRPQDRIPLKKLSSDFKEKLPSLKPKDPPLSKKTDPINIFNTTYTPRDGDIVIAAITSCTNTSNASVLMAAGLVAKKAVELGLSRKSWVKTSLAPGSQVVTDYLNRAGLLPFLENLGFHVVGYGCTTCIGNSGPLPEVISQTYKERGLVAASVLSGNRNFEGRVHSDVRANYLASPPLVVAYSIAGNVQIDLATEPLGRVGDQDIFLKDIWPSPQEIQNALDAITAEMYIERYSKIYEGTLDWQKISVADSLTYPWNNSSTYVQNPPYFRGLQAKPSGITDIMGARALAVFGDSITTDHISPAGAIKGTSPAGVYLQSLGVDKADFNSYGSRRGNHEVMMRGTFANVRIKNLVMNGAEGGNTIYWPTKETLSIYDAAMKYSEDKTPTIILAGKEYGSGSSRDWAAKGPKLQGVRAVIAESFERIHRSNLVGMGILPLQFMEGQNVSILGLTGRETFNFKNLNQVLVPGGTLCVDVIREDGSEASIEVKVRIDTPVEIEYYKNGGILPFVLRSLI